MQQRRNPIRGKASATNDPQNPPNDFPSGHRVLGEATSAVAKSRRARIEGEFFKKFSEENGAPPSSAEINDHVWEVEMAAKVPFQHADLYAEVYKQVFDSPTETDEVLTIRVACALGANNPAHTAQIRKLIKHALGVRRDIYWLAKGGFGNSDEDVQRWLVDVVHFFVESNALDAGERRKLAFEIIDEEDDNLGLDALSLE